MPYTLSKENHNPVSVHEISPQVFNQTSATFFQSTNTQVFGTNSGAPYNPLSTVIYSDFIETRFWLNSTAQFAPGRCILFGSRMTPPDNILVPDQFETSGSVIIDVANSLNEERFVVFGFVAKAFSVNASQVLRDLRIIPSSFESGGGDELSWNQRMIFDRFNFSNVSDGFPFVFGFGVYNVNSPQSESPLSMVGSYSVRRNRKIIDTYDGTRG